MASVAMAGGTFGYSFLWVVILSALLACTNQYMAAKTGIIAGQGIIALVAQRWGTFWSRLLLVDVLLATWLAAAALMKALVQVTGLITSWPTPWWGVFWAGVLGVLLIRGGYRFLERVSKILVALVVLCFMATAITVHPHVGALMSGLIPTFPCHDQAALMMAAIMGGAVHITIIAMHTYTVNQRKWQTRHLPLAALDTFWGMFVAFGLYSTAIFITGAAWLHPRGVEIKTALDLARALTPVLGPLAGPVFLLGLLAAVLSTITPTLMAGGFFLADGLGTDTRPENTIFRGAIAAGCVVSLAGPLLPGGWLIMLMIMLAMGLCGTPLIIAMNLVLLNTRSWAGPHANGIVVNVLGVFSLVLTTFLAGRWILTTCGILS
jgi:manganese transport protein